MIRIAVCDDERYFCNKIKEILTNYAQKNAIQCEIDIFESGQAFLDLGLEMHKYKVIYLDVNMEPMDGLETARQIRYVNSEILIAFVTAFINYTLEGYKVDAIRYILKGGTNFKDAIEESLEAVLKKMNHKVVKKNFHFIEGDRCIPLSNLIYIESKLHKLQFYALGNDTYTLYGTLNDLEKELAGGLFIRMHQSYLVNLQYVKKMTRYEATLINGVIIMIPRARYKRVEEAYVSYKGEM